MPATRAADGTVAGLVAIDQLANEVPNDATQEGDSPMDRMERSRQSGLGTDVRESDSENRTAQAVE